jgi:predicted XRE-type DNA-binding protein
MMEPISRAFSSIYELVQKHEPVLVIIDSLGKALGEDPLDPKVAIKSLHSTGYPENSSAYRGSSAQNLRRWCVPPLRKYGSIQRALGTFTPAAGTSRRSQNADGTTQLAWYCAIKKQFGDYTLIFTVLSFVNQENNLTLCASELAQVDTSAEALGTRGEIVSLLRQQPLTADQLAEALGIARTTVSDHLRLDARQVNRRTWKARQSQSSGHSKDSDELERRDSRPSLRHECQHSEPPEDKLTLVGNRGRYT